jgi:hypothetical protein
MGSITSKLLAFTNPIIGKLERKTTDLPLVTWGARLEGGSQVVAAVKQASAFP